MAAWWEYREIYDSPERRERKRGGDMARADKSRVEFGSSRVSSVLGRLMAYVPARCASA